VPHVDPGAVARAAEHLAQLFVDHAKARVMSFLPAAETCARVARG
jgi:hypothetical protein